MRISNRAKRYLVKSLLVGLACYCAFLAIVVCGVLKDGQLTTSAFIATVQLVVITLLFEFFLTRFRKELAPVRLR